MPNKALRSISIRRVHRSALGQSDVLERAAMDASRAVDHALSRRSNTRAPLDRSPLRVETSMDAHSQSLEISPAVLVLPIVPSALLAIDLSLSARELPQSQSDRYEFSLTNI